MIIFCGDENEVYDLFVEEREGNLWEEGCVCVCVCSFSFCIDELKVERIILQHLD